MKLILASNNQGKIAEIKSLLPQLTIVTMREAGFTEEIPEPYDTFCLNALQKASTVWKWANSPVLADDSGICVEALDDEPGVFSARYAGEHASDEQNNQKLQRKLEGVENRSAFYYAKICLIVDGSPCFFEGRCRGRIADAPKGNGGFGYDPLFIPDGYDQSFGELSNEIKSRISHRAEALAALKAFIDSDAGAALIQKVV